MVKASAQFIPVFVDTLSDYRTTKRFKESYGSYPVLRIHNLSGEDIGGRINTNLTAGIVKPAKVVEQMKLGLKRFAK